jgi:hypothetical protein
MILSSFWLIGSKMSPIIVEGKESSVSEMLSQERETFLKSFPKEMCPGMSLNWFLLEWVG